MLPGIEEAEDKRAQRGAGALVALAGLRNMLTEKTFVLGTLGNVSEQSIDLMPRVAKSRLRLQLGFGGVIHSIGMIHAYAIELARVFVGADINTFGADELACYRGEWRRRCEASHGIYNLTIYDLRKGKLGYVLAPRAEILLILINRLERVALWEWFAL